MIKPDNKIPGQTYSESTIMTLIAFDSEVNSERAVSVTSGLHWAKCMASQAAHLKERIAGFSRGIGTHLRSLQLDLKNGPKQML